MYGAMERDDGLAGAGRTGNTCRAKEVTLDDAPLRGVPVGAWSS
jgi:hypothetical protein